DRRPGLHSPVGRTVSARRRRSRADAARVRARRAVLRRRRPDSRRGPRLRGGMDARVTGAETKTAWVGRALPRFEDERFTTGAAKYVDDLAVPGVLHAAFVRSPAAHALL